MLKASRILNHSYVDFKEREDLAELMTDAFTFERGENQGEILKQMNAEYHKKVDDLTKKVQKAKGK